ncbi:MAG: haloacid dehalogenase-like hydrolase [Minicystis sp.]
MSPQRTKVFISYAQEDTPWLERLQTFLRPLEREGRIDRWDHTRLRAGDRSEEEIARALADAGAAVFLVSSNFLASDFINDVELKTLLTRAHSHGVRVIPVIVGACLLEMSPLTKFEPIHPKPLKSLSEAEQDAVLAETARAVLEAVEGEPIAGWIATLVEVSKRRVPRAVVRAIAILLALLVVGVGGGLTWVHWHPPLLKASAAWDTDNAHRLNTLIRERGRTSPGYSAEQKPVAVLDWDNTVIHNDSGDLVVYWMLQKNGYFLPADWRETSPFLTKAAIAALTKACGTATAPQQRLVTSDNVECKSLIWTFYADPEDGFGGVERPFSERPWNHERMHPRYAWGSQLLVGHTHDEVRAIAREALAYGRDDKSIMEIGAMRARLGVSYHPEMADLIKTMKRHGFDVWVVSASPQPVVEVFAEQIGVPADHVIGIKQKVGAAGRFEPGFVGCGGDEEVIPYRQGKRCWINEKIFGVSGPAAMERSPRRPVFAAGDSLTDLDFLRDATELRLVLNRHQAAVMCYAIANRDHKWLVNRPFNAPYKWRKRPYHCTSACEDRDGAAVGCVDDDKPIPDGLHEPPEWQEHENSPQ